MRTEHDGKRAVDELSTRELTSRLGEQLTTLARAELALAKAELFARGRQAAMGGGLFGAAAVVALGAYLTMIAAAVAGIDVALPLWASALIVGGGLALLAGALALLGRSRVSRVSPPLEMTTGTVKRDIAELTHRNGHAAGNGHPGKDGEVTGDARSSGEAQLGGGGQPGESAQLTAGSGGAGQPGGDGRT